MRPAKADVLRAISEAKIKGDIHKIGSLFDVDYVTDFDCGVRTRSFNGKMYRTAQVAINVYLANILRKRKSIGVIKRDVQLHYIEEKKACYQLCINPRPDECIEDDYYEIALVAKGDGQGNFDYFLYDSTIWEEYQRKYVRKNYYHQNEKKFQKAVEFLSKFTSIYKLSGQDEFFGILQDQKEHIQIYGYDKYLILDEIKTEQHGKGVVQFFVVNTLEYRQLLQAYKKSLRMHARLLDTLTSNEQNRKHLEDQLGIEQPSTGDLDPCIEYYL